MQYRGGEAGAPSHSRWRDQKFSDDSRLLCSSQRPILLWHRRNVNGDIRRTLLCTNESEKPLGVSSVVGFPPPRSKWRQYTCARSIFFPTVEGNLKSQMKICVGFYSPDISWIKNQHTRIRWAWSSVIYKKIPWKKLWGNIKTDRGQRWAGRPHWISFSVPPCLLFWRQNTRGGFPCTQHLRTAASPCLSLLQYFYLTFHLCNISNKLDIWADTYLICVFRTSDCVSCLILFHPLPIAHSTLELTSKLPSSSHVFTSLFPPDNTCLMASTLCLTRFISTQMSWTWPARPQINATNRPTNTYKH